MSLEIINLILKFKSEFFFMLTKEHVKKYKNHSTNNIDNIEVNNLQTSKYKYSDYKSFKVFYMIYLLNCNIYSFCNTKLSLHC
jgi:hypothetical protein